LLVIEFLSADDRERMRSESEVRELYRAASAEPPLSEPASVAELFARLYALALSNEELSTAAASENGVLAAFIVTRINTLIDDEAFRGIQTDASRALLQRTVDWFASRGADAVILGCTDLLLFGLESIGHGVLPIIDSTAAHAAAAAARSYGVRAVQLQR